MFVVLIRKKVRFRWNVELLTLENVSSRFVLTCGVEEGLATPILNEGWRPQLKAAPDSFYCLLSSMRQRERTPGGVWARGWQMGDLAGCVLWESCAPSALEAGKPRKNNVPTRRSHKSPPALPRRSHKSPPAFGTPPVTTLGAPPPPALVWVRNKTLLGNQ